MGKLGRLVAVVIAVGTGLAGLVMQADAVSADPRSTETAFVAKLNEFRAARGLGQLAVRPDLVDVARAWSLKMLGRNDIAHNPDLASQAPADWDRLGENVGVGATVEELHDAFVASPTHVRQMVDPAFDSVGIGVATAPDGEIFVTVNFMTSRSVAPAAAATPSSSDPGAPPSVSPATSSAAPAPAAVRVCRRTRGRLVCSTTRRARPARRVSSHRR